MFNCVQLKKANLDCKRSFTADDQVADSVSALLSALCKRQSQKTNYETQDAKGA